MKKARRSLNSSGSAFELVTYSPETEGHRNSQNGAKKEMDFEFVSCPQVNGGKNDQNGHVLSNGDSRNGAVYGVDVNGASEQGPRENGHDGRQNGVSFNGATVNGNGAHGHENGASLNGLCVGGNGAHGHENGASFNGLSVSGNGGHENGASFNGSSVSGNGGHENCGSSVNGASKRDSDSFEKETRLYIFAASIFGVDLLANRTRQEDTEHTNGATKNDDSTDEWVDALEWMGSHHVDSYKDYITKSKCVFSLSCSYVGEFAFRFRGEQEH